MKFPRCRWHVLVVASVLAIVFRAREFLTVQFTNAPVEWQDPVGDRESVPRSELAKSSAPVERPDPMGDRESVPHSELTTSSAPVESSDPIGDRVSVPHSELTKSGVCPPMPFLGNATVPFGRTEIGQLHHVSGKWDEKFDLKAVFVDEHNVSSLPHMLRRWADYSMVRYNAPGHPSVCLFMSTTANVVWQQRAAKVALSINFGYALKHGVDFLAMHIPCWRSLLGAGWVKPWGLQEAVRQSYVRAPWVVFIDHDAVVNPAYWGRPLLEGVMKRHKVDGDKVVAICQPEPDVVPKRRMETDSRSNVCENDECRDRNAQVKAAIGTNWWKRDMGCNIGALFLKLPSENAARLAFLDGWVGVKFRGDCKLGRKLSFFKADQSAFNYCFIPRHEHEIAMVQGFAPWNSPSGKQWIIHSKQFGFEKWLNGICKDSGRSLPPGAEHVICALP